jgi:hypothetical protein
VFSRQNKGGGWGIRTWVSRSIFQARKLRIDQPDLHALNIPLSVPRGDAAQRDHGIHMRGKSTERSDRPDAERRYRVGREQAVVVLIVGRARRAVTVRSGLTAVRRGTPVAQARSHRSPASRAGAA